MERALDISMASKPFIKGMLCADSNGLLIASKGEMDPKLAGRFSSMVKNAAMINPDVADPTILIESASRNIVVKNYDSMTVTMSCLKAEE